MVMSFLCAVSNASHQSKLPKLDLSCQEGDLAEIDNTPENISKSLMEFRWITDDSVTMYFDILNEKVVKKKSIY